MNAFGGRRVGVRRAVRGRAGHRRCALRLGQFALETAAVVEQRRDARRHLVGSRLEHGGGGFQPVFLLDQERARRFAGERLDAADPAGDSRLTDDLEQGNVAERRNVGATT